MSDVAQKLASCRYRVVVSRPRERVQHVFCKSIDQCLDVVAHEKDTAPNDTDIFLESRRGRTGGVLDYQAKIYWFKDKGRWRRESIRQPKGTR